MKTFLKTFAAVSLMSGAAFADAEFHPSTYTTYKKHGAYSGSVQVLNNLPGNELSYTEIGMVRVSTKEVGSFYDALDQLKDEAAKHGGTAVVLEDDAKIFSEGGVTERGTTPENVTAIAVIRH